MVGDYREREIEATNFPIGVTQHKLRPVIRCALCTQIGAFIETADDVLRFLVDHECDGGNNWRQENTGTG